jgi:hypothetical protein
MNSTEIRREFADQLSWPDAQLLLWATGIIGVPKEAPADSFVLHAPLELMARAALLPMLDPGARVCARARIVWLVANYREAGVSVARPASISPQSLARAASSLLAAIEASELDEVDRYAAWLGDNASADEVKRLLGPWIGSSLAAAAHGGIALHLMGRTPAVGGSILRGVVREIARHPDWRVQPDGLVAGDRPLLEALLEIPELGMPGSNFIYPMVSHGSDVASRLLADVSGDPTAGARALSRVAAWSMLQESPEHAPYGWTHTLTIPQAVMSLDLDPAIAVAIAATQVVGFRASMGSRPIDPRLSPPAITPLSPVALATNASRHFDAHLVKYTLACFDAATRDPQQADLYSAAASYLWTWWASQPDDGFFENEGTRS